MAAKDMTTFQTVIMEARAHRNLREHITADLKQHNLTVMEWALLGLVNEHQEKGVSVSDLARILDVKTALTSVMVSKQVKTGLLEKAGSDVDNRLRYVRLTDKGARQVQKIEADLDHSLKSWLHDVDKKELTAYLKVTAHLSGAPA